MDSTEIRSQVESTSPSLAALTGSSRVALNGKINRFPVLKIKTAAMIDLDRMTNDPTYERYAYRTHRETVRVRFLWWTITLYRDV